jgi:RNA polymerase sigma-70 factor (ECF subfamily)
MEDQLLIALLKKNDPSAMEALFKAYHASLCRVAYRMIKDTDQAKDIAQEVFIKLWKNRQSLQINTTLEGYLKRAVINTALNHLESGSRYSKQSLESSDLTSRAANTVEHTVMADELSQKASQAIHDLPLRTRMVFTLIRVEDMSYSEVSEALGISLKAVEKEMMKALRLLREALKEYIAPSIVLILLNAF